MSRHAHALAEEAGERHEGQPDDAEQAIEREGARRRLKDAYRALDELKQRGEVGLGGGLPRRPGAPGSRRRELGEKRFLVKVSIGEEPEPRFHVVLSWPSLL